MKHDLLPYCSHAQEREDFVGVRFEFDNALNHHRPYIIFPYGYDYTSNEDVLCLISTLSDYQREMQNVARADLIEDEQHGFPIQSYRFIIQPYMPAEPMAKSIGVEPLKKKSPSFKTTEQSISIYKLVCTIAMTNTS